MPKKIWLCHLFYDSLVDWLEFQKQTQPSYLPNGWVYFVKFGYNQSKVILPKTYTKIALWVVNCVCVIFQLRTLCLHMDQNMRHLLEEFAPDLLESETQQLYMTLSHGKRKQLSRTLSQEQKKQLSMRVGEYWPPKLPFQFVIPFLTLFLSRV